MNIEPMPARGTVGIELSLKEVDRLMGCFMHAKFSEDPRLIVYLNSSLNELIAGLLQAGKAMGETTGWFDPKTFQLDDGFQGLAAFPIIRSELEFEFPSEDQAALLDEALYPFTAIEEG